MYTLIQNGKASMMELEEYYTLDEALKLYALMCMRIDIENAMAKEVRENAGKGVSG